MALTARKNAIKAQLEKQKRRRLATKAEGTEALKSHEEWYAREINKLTVYRIHGLIKKYVFPAIDEALKPKATDGLTDSDGIKLVMKALDVVLTLQRRSTLEVEDLALEHYYKVDKYEKAKIIESIKKAIGVDISSILSDEKIEKRLRDHISKNVQLIKRIPKRYFLRVNKVIKQGFASGSNAFSLKKDLMEIAGIEKRHAKLIAQDQTSKLTSDLDRIRQEDIGVTHYTWRTVGDESVRPSHRRNNKKRFAWNDPPSDTGNPGHDVQCRCVADPDLTPLLR